jgi:signal transduction histidine kinase
VFTAFSDQVWKPRTSVKVRFALAQGLFITLIIGLLAGTLYLTVRPRLVSTIDNSYKILVNNLAASVFQTFQTGDNKAVTDAIRKVEGQQGVRYVLLIDKNNVVYYDSIASSESLKGKNYTDELTTQIVSKKDTVVGKVERDGETFYNYAFPLVAGNEIAYTIRLGVEEQVIDGEFNRLSRLFIYLGCFGIIMGIIAAYLLAARLTKPIIALTESALAIRAGNLNAYAAIATNDELEQLSREFQGMVEKLKQFYFQEYHQKKEALDGKKRMEEINTRLQELDKQKTDFLNTASHQLRTPLSVIHWSLSMIVDEASHLNIPKQQQELLEESLKSTKRMVDLVNDLLDISRIEQGRKELDWQLSNYGKVCKDLVAALQPLAANKNLQLTYEEPMVLPDSYLDPKAFYEVVNNFVDNAIKYTPEGWVKVRAQESGGSIQITIQDSGIGMNDEERAVLFTRFARGKEASKLFANGSGLGMYVAQSILRQHGGDIEVQSEKGKGTSFILSLPIFKEVPNPAPSAGGEDDRYAQVGATTSSAANEVATVASSTPNDSTGTSKTTPS